MKTEILKEPSVHEISEIFKALADPLRLRILLKLSQGACSIDELTHILELDSSHIFPHLVIMENMGLIQNERIGQVVNHRLKMTCLIQFCHCLCDLEREDPGDCC